MTVANLVQYPGVDQELLNRAKLLQLADSALPVGSLSHSFGLEALTEEHCLSVSQLHQYLSDSLAESLTLDAVYFRFAYTGQGFADLNRRYGALRLARESREASAAMGRRLLRLVSQLDSSWLIEDEGFFPVAFGYVCGSLVLGEEAGLAAFLQQAIWNMISSCQRLLRLGQVEAARLLWDAKPAILACVERSSVLDLDTVTCFAPLPELASMRHPRLHGRLFIS